MRRFHVELPSGASPQPGQRVLLDAEETRHIRSVLRLKDGDRIALTDGLGHALEGVLVGGDKRGALVELDQVARAEAEVAPPLLHLACAVVKGRRYEAAVEKAVELGAHVVTPLITDHGVIEPGSGKRDRWHNLLITALKQCHRCHRPELREPTGLLQVLDARPGEAYFGAAPGDLVGEQLQDATPLAAQATRRRLEGQAPPAELLVLIGPEGGWSPAELHLLAGRGAVPLSLGPHVLRTETAAIAGLVALQQVRRAWLDRPGARA